MVDLKDRFWREFHKLGVSAFTIAATHHARLGP